MPNTENSFVIDDVNESQAVRDGVIVLPTPSPTPEDHPHDHNNDDEGEEDLPGIVSASDLLANESLQQPPQLVHGVIHQGTKAVVAGPSKTHKTWVLLDLAVSVAMGIDWWGWHTTAGKVLFVNFELHPAFIRSRLQAICQEKKVEQLENLDIWNLRGHAAAFDKLMPRMQDAILHEQYTLILVDPVYKGLAGMDENKATDINNLCNTLEKLAKGTGASVVYSHHFAKGNGANKDSIDRMSGSGVFARDADTIITLTPHEEEKCFTVDLTLRNFAQHQPIVVEWQYPLMIHNPDHDPRHLKGKSGPKAKITATEVLEFLKDEPMQDKDWEAAVINDFDVSESTFKRVKAELKADGKIEKTADGKWQMKPERTTSTGNTN